jgi:hypothetical protein
LEQIGAGEGHTLQIRVSRGRIILDPVLQD